MTQQQQVQIVVCNDCSLARAAVHTAPSKLTIVGAVQQIAPCPFCVFRQDVVANLERAEGVIRELQGMAEPVVMEATPPPEPALLADVRALARDVVYAKRGETA